MSLVILLFTSCIFFNDGDNLSDLNGTWWPDIESNGGPGPAMLILYNGNIEYRSDQMGPYIDYGKGTYINNNGKITFNITHVNVAYLSMIFADLYFYGEYKDKIQFIDARYYSKNELISLGFREDSINEYLFFGIDGPYEYTINGNTLRINYNQEYYKWITYIRK